jgi:hypothetical protein
MNNGVCGEGSRGRHKSKFVTSIAVIGITLSIFQLLSLAGKTIAAFTDSREPPGPSSLIGIAYEYTQFMLHHKVLVFTVVWVWSIAALISSIGVLRRRQWSRRLFVAVLISILIYVLIAPVIWYALSSHTVGFNDADFQQFFWRVETALTIVSILLASGIVFVVIKFSSSQIRDEFASREAAA